MPLKPEYIAYFDESGDHGLVRIDRDFPVFVLCGCVFRIDAYVQSDSGAFSALKFDHFGHDAVIFHSRDIRKRVGPFQVLSDEPTRDRFMSDVANFYRNTTGTIIAAGIHKQRHKLQYAHPSDPYNIALLFCLERLYGFLRDQGRSHLPMTCIFECRGDAEDKALAATFTRICSGENRWGPLPFRMVFASKMTNMPGLQIADLAAYPIARHILNSTAPNPAFDAVQTRFRRAANGTLLGWGLKIFP